MNLTGAVLAGGQSSRMGSDKALLEIDGKTFVQHVAGVLAAACGQVIVIGGDAGRFSMFGDRWFADVVPDCGPLGGIHSALSHAPTDEVLIAACDLPLISPDAVRYLVEQRNPEHEISIVLHEDVIQPLLGVYSRSCLPALERFLENSGRKVWEFLNERKMETIDLRNAPFDLPEDLLLNINTPEEYERIRNRGTPTRGE